jgi:dTDP-3-amino-3,4,6-trideoxy-alpha-D-glucose transaminase
MADRPTSTTTSSRAILRERLALLPAWTDRRRTLARAYRESLAPRTGITVPAECDSGHVYHLFPILSDARDQLQSRLRERGVETLIHYPISIPRQPAFADVVGPDACPNAERVCGTVLSLPLYPSLTADDVSVVTAAIEDAA